MVSGGRVIVPILIRVFWYDTKNPRHVRSVRLAADQSHRALYGVYKIMIVLANVYIVHDLLLRSQFSLSVCMSVCLSHA